MPYLLRCFSALSGRRRLSALAFLVLGIFVSVAAHAQVGDLSGTVKDSTGAAIPGATVTITNVATGEVHPMKTGDHGEYRAVNLVLGKYAITAAAAGFGTTKESVDSSSVQRLRPM